MPIEEVLSRVTAILDTGINIIGFVSPSHFIPQVRVIITAIEQLGYSPTWVYNTNGYDKADILRTFEGIIDVWLPDFKYMDQELAKELSDAPDYPQVAASALKEMYRQKGSALIVNENGYAESGILVRHLVLPGHVQNSLDVLRFIAGEISPRLHIGLMSQYHPTRNVARHPELKRTLARNEYLTVIRGMEKLGMNRGYIQGMSSYNHYTPDFDKNHPFEMD
jgi:putative pyruvate formate lyase activating enzyme